MYVIQAAVAPQPGEEGIKMKTVIGYNGNGRGNMVCSPDQGYHNILEMTFTKTRLNIKIETWMEIKWNTSPKKSSTSFLL